jgi:hypothetical protein
MMRNYIILSVVFCLGVAIGALVGGLFASDATPSADNDAARLRGGSVAAADDANVTYEDAALGFSLTYPKELAVTEYEEEGGARTLVFAKPGEQYGFQIFIAPYAGKVITEERLRKDLPGAAVREPVEVVIGSGIQASAFWSESPVIGESREVWFIYDGYLYEATTYARLDSLLGEVLATIDFK